MRPTLSALLLPLTLVLLFGPSPGRAEGSARTGERPILLVLDLKLENASVDRDDANGLTGAVAVLTAEDPTFQVIAGEDLRRLLELEAQRQLMDCGDDSCLAEISDALGAEYVIFGTVGKLGANTTVQLQVYDHDNARPVARQLVTMASLDNAVDDLRPAVTSLVAEAKRDHATQRMLEGTAGESPSGGVALPIALLAGGITVAVASVAIAAAVVFIPRPLVDDVHSEGLSPLIQDASAPLVPDVGDLTSPLALSQIGVALVSGAAFAVALGVGAYGGYWLFQESAE